MNPSDLRQSPTPTLTKSKSQYLNELKHARTTGVLLETDPLNAYGPNYNDLHRTIKIYYKFLRVRKYIQAEPEDEDQLLKYNFKFYFGVIGTALLGYNIAKGFAHLTLQKFPRALNHTNKYKGAYYGLFGAAIASVVHSYLYTQFSNEFCEPFIEKYREEAVKNGFDDYEISKDVEKFRILDFDWLIV